MAPFPRMNLQFVSRSSAFLLLIAGYSVDNLSYSVNEDTAYLLGASRESFAAIWKDYGRIMRDGSTICRRICSLWRENNPVRLQVSTQPRVLAWHPWVGSVSKDWILVERNAVAVFKQYVFGVVTKDVGIITFAYVELCEELHLLRHERMKYAAGFTYPWRLGDQLQPTVSLD